MIRWDYIQKNGKAECAKAIAFCIVKTVKGNRISCNELIGLVNEIQPTLENWLSEEIEEE